MAANSVGGLFINLGLSLDQLETDFIAAEKTTQQNIVPTVPSVPDEKIKIYMNF